MRDPNLDTATSRILYQISSSRGSLPRLLVILAHPDDEVLALGGRLDRLCDSRFLCVTNGAPENGADSRAHGFLTLEAYAEARREELSQALSLAGLPTQAARQVVLPSPTNEAARSTSNTIPDQASVFHLVALTRRIASEIDAFQPEAVLTHPYEGGHPDHDSCAFAVHTAMRLLRRLHTPPILEAPFYHAQCVWRPNQDGFQTDQFLPLQRALQGEAPTTLICNLSVEEQQRKRERIACFITQRETLVQFQTEREQFRRAPDYDFTQPPHSGRLLYESFPWGMIGRRFRELAATALETLLDASTDPPETRSR